MLELVLSLALSFQPSTALQARVLTEEGTPVIDANVSIVGQPGSVRTDSRGYFTWNPPPQAPFEVLVVLSDGRYVAPVFIEELPEDGDLVIVVEPLSSEDVTVSSSVTPNIEAPPASGMTTVVRSDIARRAPVRLSEAVENVAGVSTTSDLHASVPIVRGLSGGRTLILLDGGRVTSERRAGPSATYLDPFFLEGVEVSRGPGSVAYGSDAFGGIIHARTRRPEAGQPLRFRFRGTLAAGLPQKTAGAEVSWGLPEGGFLLQGRYRDFDDYQSARGEVDNSAASDKGFLGRFQHEVGPGVLSLGWQSDFGRSIGRPDTRNPELRVFYSEEDSDRFSASYDLDPVGGFSRLKMDFFLGRYQVTTRRDENPTAGQGRIIDDADVKAEDYGFRAVATRPLGRGRVEFGIDLNGRFDLEAIDRSFTFSPDGQLVSASEGQSIEDARKRDTAFYVSGETAFNKFLTGSAGLRYDRITTRNQGGGAGDVSTDNGALSGFGALTAKLTRGLTLTGQVSRGFRDATLSDRFFTGITARGFITGNPDLQPEESIQYDMSMRYTASQWKAAVFYYHYRIDDLIERFEGQPDLFFFRNRGRARLRGLEVEVETDLPSRWTLQAAAAAAGGTALDDDQPLADIATENLRLVLRRPLAEKGYLHLQGSLFARDEEPGPSEIVMPGYFTFDAGFGWEVERGYNLRFLVRNLFDKDYPISPDSRAIAAPGIAGLVTLEVDLQ
ncbi:MAG TPA: TonB-dependent receptor [Acidobacteriota bacterium]|nr:TonB-dependent receptor [Acidobacteriota bacterium]